MRSYVLKKVTSAPDWDTIPFCEQPFVWLGIDGIHTFV